MLLPMGIGPRQKAVGELGRATGPLPPHFWVWSGAPPPQDQKWGGASERDSGCIPQAEEKGRRQGN